MQTTIKLIFVNIIFFIIFAIIYMAFLYNQYKHDITKLWKLLSGNLFSMVSCIIKFAISKSKNLENMRKKFKKFAFLNNAVKFHYTLQQFSKVPTKQKHVIYGI